MAIQIQYRRGTAAEWTSANPVLAAGEPGYETDTGKFKVGNGSSAWSALSYSSGITGNTGNTGTIYVGSTTVVAPNVNPSVTNSGNTTNANFVFSLPRAYNVSVGTTSTLAPGGPATVTNAGNTTDIVLNFGIPLGNVGNTGPTGPVSPKSISIISPLAADMITITFTNTALTLSEVRSVLVGGSTPTANFHISHGTSRASPTNVFTSGCSTGNTTVGQANTTFNNGSIAANSYIWIYLNAVTGSPTELNVTLR